MPLPVANLLVTVVATHLLAGVAFAVAFHAVGLRRIDAAAAGGSWGFRVLVTPGVVLLWPLLLARWRRGAVSSPTQAAIDRLRRRHRRASAALALALPPAFALALSARPPAESPADLGPLLSVPAVAAERWAREDLWGPLAIRTRAFAASGDGGPVVELAPVRDLRRPSVLVYWAPAGTAEALPPGAHLVGRLAGVEARRFVLPPAAESRPGRLYLWSLGHHELLGSAALPGGAH